MPRPRRLVIQQADGSSVTHTDGTLLMIDLTGLHNANAQIPLRVVVEEQCDLLCWHDLTSGSELPCWGPDA